MFTYVCKYMCEVTSPRLLYTMRLVYNQKSIPDHHPPQGCDRLGGRETGILAAVLRMITRMRRRVAQHRHVYHDVLQHGDPNRVARL